MIMLVSCGEDSASGKAADPIEEISVESRDDLPNCTKKREGVRAVTEKGSFVCADGVWEAEKKEIPSYETEDELPNCSNKKEGKVVYVVDMEDTLICESGEWKNVNGSGDDGTTEDESSSSDEEPDVDESSSGSQSQQECELTVATEGDLPACSMKRDGITACIENIGEVVVCESGMWSIKISSSSSSESFESSSSEGEESSSSVESSAEVEISSDAGNGNSSAYDCSVYNCVTTEYLNQDMLESGLYGEYLDTRDNQVYKTVVIGTQTWMAQNLNYETEESACYQSEDENCVQYGRLYLQSEAEDVCPRGWHLPSNEEWNGLNDYISEISGRSDVGNMLKSKTWVYGEKGSDMYGFSGLASHYFGSVLFCGSSTHGLYWTSDVNEYRCLLSDNTSLYYYKDSNSTTWGMSVRCLKD